MVILLNHSLVYSHLYNRYILLLIGTVKKFFVSFQTPLFFTVTVYLSFLFCDSLNHSKISNNPFPYFQAAITLKTYIHIIHSFIKFLAYVFAHATIKGGIPMLLVSSFILN